MRSRSALVAPIVTAIPLAYATSDARDAFGNPLHETGTFTRANGAPGAVIDVWFRYLPR